MTTHDREQVFTRPTRRAQPRLPRRPLAQATLVLAGLALAKDTQGQNLVQNTIDAFSNSDIVFQRGRTNVPFLPLAIVSAREYSDTEVANEDNGERLSFDQRGVSAMGVAPFLLNSTDALFVGGYLSHQHFTIRDEPTGPAPVEDFEVSTLAVPVAWMRQVNPEWQTAAFVMPMAHYSTQDSSAWTMQTMGGVFARYARRDDLWWAYGLFADYSPNDSYVLPYVGASWNINERWTLSAIMPWPALNYSPTPDWRFSLGATISGASWSLAPRDNEVSVNLDGWDFGLTVERRLQRSLWISARAGVSGLRGLRFNTDRVDIEDPDLDVGSSGFFAISLKLRPGNLP